MSELMRRAAPGLAIAGVALSTVWLFDPALHVPDDVELAAAADPSSSGEATDDGATTDPGTTTDDSTTSGGTTDQGTTATDCSTTTTETGDAAMTQWGPVQVQMEFAADGTVCSVTALTYPDGDHHSARINAMAIPYLNEQATAVGVEFDAVSGATYTSAAYRQSMQSILDQR